jgi:hypothetical protein
MKNDAFGTEGERDRYRGDGGIMRAWDAGTWSTGAWTWRDAGVRGRDVQRRGFAEHVARYGLLPLAGLFLVVGTIREFSREGQPVPRQRVAVTIMAGTGDRAVNYDG